MRMVRLAVLLSAGMSLPVVLLGDAMPGEEYALRRQKVLEAMEEGVLLLRNSGTFGADGFQGNQDFYYLTGLSQEGGALLLAPGGVRFRSREPGADYYDGKIYREILLLPEASSFDLRWDGPKLAEAEAREISGLETVLPLGKFPAILNAALSDASLLYFEAPPAAIAGAAGDPDLSFLKNLRERFFWLEIRNAAVLVHPLRVVKSRLELDRIQRAVDLTGEGIREVLGQARAGILESEIEGIIGRVFLGQGARFSFPPIVGAGKNSTILHYRENSHRLGEGEVVVLDVGARVEQYAADVSRTFPVSGTFSDRQAEIYRLVLSAQRAGIDAIRSGVTFSEIHAASFRVIEDAGYGDSFLHGTSHHLGLDVHDVGDLHAPLPAGAVITVEPGIYLQGEEIGVRIEDVVLVTETGNQVLSDAIPRDIKAIESAMSRK